MDVAWRPFCPFRHETWSCNLKVYCPVCPKLHMLHRTPGLNTSTCQYSVSHSATYWQQEITCFTLWCTPPSGVTRSTSNVVRKALRPWWCFTVRIGSFHGNVSPWRHSEFKINCCNSTVHGQIPPKFHIFDKIPDLKTSTWQNSLIAPPSGNRKL